jgi:hypothetical protein
MLLWNRRTPENIYAHDGRTSTMSSHSSRQSEIKSSMRLLIVMAKGAAIERSPYEFTDRNTL